MTTARADEIYIFTTILYKKNENKIKKIINFYLNLQQKII